MVSLKKHIIPLSPLQLLLMIGLFVCGLETKGQTATIPDTVFRNFLKRTNPLLIDANGRLILAEAAKVGGVVNGSNLNITNIEGIQYFVNARAISFVSAALTFIPDISNLTKLEAINLMYNNITTLPSLNNLKRLKNLNIHSNRLTSLPSLSNNDSLVELNLNTNQLTSLPDLKNLKQLQRFYVHNNQLKILSGSESLISLYDFTCSGNQLGNFPSLATWTKIQNFEASNNKLTAAPYFGTNTTLQTVDLSSNSISSFDFKGCTSLRRVKLDQNKLIFSELIKVLAISRYDTIFRLFPQQALTVGRPISSIEGNSATLSTGVDKNVSNVSYEWYKNGRLDTTITGDILTLTHLQLHDAGVYTCRIKHLSFANFYLETDAFHLSVALCIDLNTASVIPTEINCMKTGTLDVTLSPAVTHLTYILESPKSGKSFTSSTGRFQGLTEPTYTLSVQTATGCRKIYPKEIKIPFQRCKDYLITPDNDGNADTFYFEESGKAEIYDKRGNLIRKMSIPAEWDCFSEKGKVPSGYYIANINDGESQIGLSVVY